MHNTALLLALVCICSPAFSQREVDDRYAPVKVPLSVIRVSVHRSNDRRAAELKSPDNLPVRIVEFDSLGRTVLDMFSISQSGFLATKQFFASDGLSAAEYMIEDSLNDPGEIECRETYDNSGKLLTRTRYIGSAYYPVYYSYSESGNLSGSVGYHIYPENKERTHDTLWRTVETYNSKGLIEMSVNYFYVNDRRSYLNETKKFEYDTMNLLTKTTVQDEDERVILTTLYRYNDLGQMIYSETVSTSGWREIDHGLWGIDEYEYDSRGNVSMHICRTNSEEKVSITKWNTIYNSDGLPASCTKIYSDNRKEYVWWKYDYR